MKTEDRIRHRFGDEAQAWSERYDRPLERSIHAYNLHRRRQHALDLLEETGGRVLDVGCGPGNVILSLDISKRLERFGCDFAVPMLHQARTNARLQDKPLHVFSADALSMPFGNRQFSSIFCLGVLEYANDVVQLLSECHRILQTHGQLIVSVPNLTSPFIQIDDFFNGIKNAVTRSVPSGMRRWLKTNLLGRDDKAYFNGRNRRFDPRHVRCLLEQIGFVVQETRYHTYGFSTLNVRLDSKLFRRAEVFAHHNKTLERFGWTCILKAVRS